MQGRAYFLCDHRDCKRASCVLSTGTADPLLISVLAETKGACCSAETAGTCFSVILKTAGALVVSAMIEMSGTLAAFVRTATTSTLIVSVIVNFGLFLISLTVISNSFQLPSAAALDLALQATDPKPTGRRALETNVPSLVKP